MIFGIKEKLIILTHTMGLYHKYPRATCDWFCDARSHI